MSAGSAFRKPVSEAACRVLTIPELKALDDADLAREIARAELQNRVKSEDEAA